MHLFADDTELAALFSSNHINETTVCWTEGWPAWVPVGDAPGLVESLMKEPSAPVRNAHTGKSVL